MKKIWTQIGCGLFLIAFLTVSAFAVNATDNELDMAYQEYSIAAEEMDKFVTLDYDSFVEDYDKCDLSLEAYVAQCVEKLANNENLSEIQQRDVEMQIAYQEWLETNMQTQDIDPQTSGEKWWHHTSTLPQATSYSKYNMLNALKKGDILYEAKGGAGITGHTALVEGKYYSSTYKQYYIRLVEAVLSGVCRGILCDERFSSQQGTIYRVTKASTSTINNAMNFAISQIGKSYKISTTKGITESRETWYCSLLAFAAYYNGSNKAINISEESVVLDGSTLISPSMISRKCATYQTTVMTA